MAALKIHTGELPSVKGVEDRRIRFIVNDWRMLASIQFPDDCRGLLQIVYETESYDVWHKMGYSSVDEFYEKELLLEPGQLTAAVSWLRANPEEEVSYSSAVERYERNVRIHKLRDDGLTQQQIAGEVGLSQRHVSNVLEEKPVMTPETSKPKRQRMTYQISQYTKPETAALKIRQKFGDDFTDKLKELL